MANSAGKLRGVNRRRNSRPVNRCALRGMLNLKYCAPARGSVNLSLSTSIAGNKPLRSLRDLSVIGISRQQLRLFSLNCYSAFLFRHERICHTPKIKQRIINGISTNRSSLIGAVTVFSHRSIRISYKNSRSRTAADTARCVRRGGKRAAARPNRTPLNRERTTIHCSTYM